MSQIPRSLLLERLRQRPSVERPFAPPTLPVEPASPMRWAAVSAILYDQGNGYFELLFIKRASQERDPWSGHMAFPGGRHEAHDPDLLATAIRETWEEVGLELKGRSELVSQLNDLQALARGREVPLIVRPYVFVMDERPSLAPNREVEQVVWVPLGVLLRGEGRDTLHWQRGEQKLELPCIRYQSYTIWGLTYYMLRELLDRLQEEDAGEGDPRLGTSS